MIATKKDVASIALALVVLSQDIPDITNVWTLIWAVLYMVVWIASFVEVATFVIVHLFLGGKAPKLTFWRKDRTNA